MSKPIKLYVSSTGPNPWKPVIILEELQIPYELKLLSFLELTGEEFKNINPCGKVPVMYDPNHDILQWESGAIVLYLIEQYDTEKKLTFDTVKEKALLYQWLMFQMSGQGPFYGQLSWFNHLHSEPLPSAISRYTEQAHRILRILNDALEGKSWLVGDKCTYADLSFFMWNFILAIVMKCEGESPFDAYPNVKAWHERIADREAVKKVVEIKQEMVESENLGEDYMPKDLNMDEIRERI
ncbi:glutathione S-transferase II [Cadophora sp. MPI-SDFR-AT-0126]|nr:glutathione S-transferase II [Leotiomycetes sp. MPI-SDFR-AT-0126]